MYKKPNEMPNPANEVAAAYMAPADALADRKQFVHNLGELLKQTREGVLSVELGLNDIVNVKYFGGGTRQVNVHMDSYAAIIRDVSKSL